MKNIEKTVGDIGNSALSYVSLYLYWCLTMCMVVPEVGGSVDVQGSFRDLWVPHAEIRMFCSADDLCRSDGVQKLHDLLHVSAGEATAWEQSGRNRDGDYLPLTACCNILH